MESETSKQDEAFEAALYRIKGGFLQTRQGGQAAFFEGIDEIRDAWTNQTAFSRSPLEAG
jgi:hypothetical protein